MMTERSKIYILPARSAVREYAALTKPELTLLSVLTAACSAYMALGRESSLLPILHAGVGTFLVGGGAGALNQYFERTHDGKMKRTEHRPLPSGTVRPQDAFVFGSACAALGVLYLVVAANAAAALLALITFVSYVFIYTPLKRKTPFATVVGSIPGALPPLIGWASVRGGLNMEAWPLFFILFFWQMPHFLSLAWMYRNDYARAGFKILTVLDPAGGATSRQILVYTIALVPASVLPTLLGMAGVVYFYTAITLSCAFLLIAIRFVNRRTGAAARTLFFASLVYLPAEFVFLLAMK